MIERELQAVAARMREDWESRARTNAEQAIYTRDKTTDITEFDASGRANYDHLIRPYLPVLLDGRPARTCSVLEIGCGVGRMTRWVAEDFGEVHAMDVAPSMIEQAQLRLADRGNVHLHLGSGYDLRFLDDACVDLVFSYIVFQHIPARAAIESYVLEAARVLKTGGAFKFHVNGDQSEEYRSHARDTWLGETFSFEEARAMIAAAGFSLVAAEGEGTQYFVLTSCKGKHERVEPSPYILPGESWAAAQLFEGWEQPVAKSWRPMAPNSRAVLGVPAGDALRFFLGLYFWPEEGNASHRVEIEPFGSVVLEGAGDRYIELDAPPDLGAQVEVRISIAPPCSPRFYPAVRSLGLYCPATAGKGNA